MGIDSHGLRFLEYVLRANGPFESTLTIGRQGLDVSERELRDYLGIAGLWEPPTSRYIDDLLVNEFGAASVASVDASGYEGATYICDLNLRLEANFPQFDTVIDAGTLEHVFDVRTSFGNIARACKIGGQILHMLPANNFVGHGLYQFSPEFFFSLYSDARGFADTEVYLADLARINAWWRVLAPTGASRSTAMSSHETYTLVRTRKTSESAESCPVQQSDYVNRWADHENDGSAASAGAYQHGPLGRLADKLPSQTTAMVLSQLRERVTQARRRRSSSMHARNAVLTRISVPPPRHRQASPELRKPSSTEGAEASD
jgi:SAM-dependent methyltransferase